MTHERSIQSEAEVRSYECLGPRCPWATDQAQPSAGAAENVGLALAGSLAAVLIWSASSHGALPYGPADLGLLLLVGALVTAILLVTSPARKRTRAAQGRESTPANSRYCQLLATARNCAAERLVHLRRGATAP